jgi:hypothetical protein
LGSTCNMPRPSSAPNAWGHFRLGPLSPGATFAWGPLSPGATFAWPLSPGATFAWGHFRLGATFDPRITRVPPTSRAKPPAKSRASRSTAHRRPRRPLPRDGPSLETAPPSRRSPPSRRPLPRDGPSLETALPRDGPPSRRPSPREGPSPGRPPSQRPQQAPRTGTAHADHAASPDHPLVQPLSPQ